MYADNEVRRAVEFGLSTLLRTKSEALHDLTYDARQRWLRDHGSELRKSLQGMTVVAFRSKTRKMLRVSPLFLPAQYLIKRYGAPSDGLVVARDAEMPGHAVIRYQGEMDQAVVWAAREMAANDR